MNRRGRINQEAYSNTRKGLRPGDPCETCGTPKKSLGVAQAVGMRFYLAGCPNEDCPSKQQRKAAP